MESTTQWHRTLETSAMAIALLSAAAMLSACGGDTTSSSLDAGPSRTSSPDAGSPTSLARDTGTDTSAVTHDTETEDSTAEDTSIRQDTAAADTTPLQDVAEDTAMASDTMGEDTPSADTTAADTDLGDSDSGAPDVDEPAPPPAVVPLYTAETELEPETHFDRGDAMVTRFADRGRDRHAREDEFQSYDHYLPHYWEHRTARFMFVDYVTKGRAAIDISFVTEWPLSVAEFRAWYNGRGTVAHYSGNYAPAIDVDGPGTYDNAHVKISDEGTQYRYTITLTSAILLNGETVPLEVGQFMEIEASQFLAAPPVGRANYYGTTFLYEVGVGGMVPWDTVGDFSDPNSDRENSVKLHERAWLGGRTTLPYMFSDEPDNHFMQMATNLSSINGQPFVLGRRVHHTDMLDGSHDESPDNGTFDALAGLVGPNYIHRSCDSCHKRNGRAPVAEPGEPLDLWVFRVGTDTGEPDPHIGRVLQPRVPGGVSSEGTVSIARWVDTAAGLRRPEYAFSRGAPAQFSARLAPPLVGMGLLEAI
ncbi:MAG: di-heme oxidoredictase family protein, partial [Myxococcota bacterium]